MGTGMRPKTESLLILNPASGKTHDPLTLSVLADLSSGVFEIAEASGVQQGTKIVLHLKDDCKEFSTEDRVKGADLLQ